MCGRRAWSQTETHSVRTRVTRLESTRAAPPDVKGDERTNYKWREDGLETKVK